MKENNFSEKENEISEETPQNQKEKKRDAGFCVLLILPYVLVSIGIAFFSVFFFKTFVETSTIWRFVVNTNAVTTPENNGEDVLSNGEIIGGSLEDLSIDTVTKPDTSETPSDTSEEVETEQIYYNKKDFPGYKWGELWASLTIPSIGLENQNVYVGESNAIYKKGIGKRFGTRFPGQGGNIVLGAHVTKEFYDLQLLTVGDKVYIETEYGSYVYEVYETKIFSIADYKYVMNYDEGEKLTLYTCHPRGTAYRTERFGVFCKKISGPEWIEVE